jgi:site-specific DNA-methyltransferase (adenine-specific)
LRASTNPGDVVFDPFAGSSTTGIAALGLNRRFIGCEVQKRYVSLSQKRLSNLQDLKGKLLSASN